MYEVMLFISKNQLSALDISESGETDWVSLEGESVLKYSKTGDLKQFSEYVKEYYNIEDFSEIDIRMSIVSFEADKKMVQFLYQQIHEAMTINIIDARNIIPLLLLKVCSVQKNTKQGVFIFGVNYCVNISETFVMDCVALDEVLENQICLYTEDCVLFSKFDGSKFGVDEKQLEELKREFTVKEQRYEEEREKLQQECDKYQKQLKEMWDKLKAFEDKKENGRVLYEFYDAVIHEIKKDEIKFKASLGNSVPRYVRKNKIVYNVQDGRLVKKNDIIAIIMTVVYFDEKLYGILNSEEVTIKAEEGGKLYHLVEDETEIELYTDIAIVAYEKDTKEEVMQWYEEIKNNKDKVLSKANGREDKTEQGKYKKVFANSHKRNRYGYFDVDEHNGRFVLSTDGEYELWDRDNQCGSGIPCDAYGNLI